MADIELSTDARKLAAKHRLAAAEATGDEDAAKAARAELDAVAKDQAREQAGTARKAAAGGQDAAKTRAPQGRTASAGKSTATAE